MSEDMRIRDFLQHVVEATQRIAEYTAGLDGADFRQNTLIQDAVIRNMEIIGEACNNIRKRAPAFVDDHADVPWGHAVGMRNVLSHGYFKVDLDALWQAVRHDVPALERQVQALLANFGPD